MELKELQRNWEKFAKVDPLWAVLTNPDKRNHKWSLPEFFRTGESEISDILSRAEALKLPLTRGRALDFGCGVGRVTQALALHFDEVVGIDIAPTMIELADQFNRHGKKCRHLVNEARDLHLFPDAHFDFVFSTIVLQHMRPEYSTNYMQEFVRILRPQGLVVFQIPSERSDVLKQTRLTEPLPDEAFLAEIHINRTSLTVGSSSPIILPLRVRNTSPVPWSASGHPDGRFQIKVGNHWLEEDGTLLLLDDGRASLPTDLRPGAEVDLSLTVNTPSRPGLYFLEIDLVQEAVAWFRDKGSPTVRVQVEVKEYSSLEKSLRLLIRNCSTFFEKFHPWNVGTPPQMEMHAVPKDEVLKVIQTSAGRVVHVIEDHCAGEDWKSLRYFVTK